MKDKIAVCLVIISLMIGAVGIAAAQSSSVNNVAPASETTSGIAESEDISATEIQEMLDPSTFEEEMKSLNLPFTPVMPSNAEIESAIANEQVGTIFPNPFLQDLPQGYWKGWKFRNYEGLQDFMWAYTLTPQASSHTIQGDVIDYGQHDDYYIAYWFGYPSMQYKYCQLLPGSECTTGKFTTSDNYVIVWLITYHTAESQLWDHMTKTSHWV